MLYKSVVPRVPIPAIDLPRFLLRMAANHDPDALAYMDTETKESITFGQLAQLTRQLGYGLVSKWDIKRQDIVAVFASNHVNFASVFLGVISAGAVICTVSSLFNVKELCNQLKDCGAKALIVGPKQMPVVQQALKTGVLPVPSNRILISTSDNRHIRGFLPLSCLLQGNIPSSYQPLAINTQKEASETMAAVVYSSGTTGMPKGVMLSHRNLVSYIICSGSTFMYFSQKQAEATNATDTPTIRRCLAIFPFTHIYGLTSLVTNSIAAGRTQYIMNQFSANKLLRAIQQYKIEYVSAVPTILSQLVNHPGLDNYDLSSLRVVSSGAAPLDKQMPDRISQWLPQILLSNGYRMSETCSAICVMTPYQYKQGSVGFLCAHMEMKIIDPKTHKSLPAGQIGEICVKGPTVMMGYLNCPRETSEIFNGDGFMRTGDIGYVSESGHIYVIERIKELIKYKGLQIAPAELESVILEHPSVLDVAVIGVERKDGSEVPRAFVVLEQNEGGIEKKIVEWIKTRMADYKRLRGGVSVVRSIPRNEAGKIMHRELRIKYMAEARSKI